MASRIADVEKCGVIYNIRCKDCDADRIGETARNLGTRLNEHRKSVQAYDLKSAVSEHAKDTDHSIHWASVKMIGRENHFLSSKIREAINIHARRPAMNRGQGYNLSPIYETILQPHQNEAPAINSKHSH